MELHDRVSNVAAEVLGCRREIGNLVRGLGPVSSFERGGDSPQNSLSLARVKRRAQVK